MKEFNEYTDQVEEIVIDDENIEEANICALQDMELDTELNENYFLDDFDLSNF